MGKISFTEEGWEDYLYWQKQDKKVLRRINKLLQDILRNGGYDGIGKPNPLRDNLSGYWSRRIDVKNRLVYRMIDPVSDASDIEIISCRDHYDDK